VVGLNEPTRIDDLTDKIEARLVQFGTEVGIRMSEVAELVEDIKDIIITEVIDDV